MTKTSLNLVLKSIILTNKVIMRQERWLKQQGQKRRIASIGLSLTHSLLSYTISSLIIELFLFKYCL